MNMRLLAGSARILPGKERPVAARTCPSWASLSGFFGENAFVFGVSEGAGDGFIEQVAVALAGDLADDLAVGADDHQRGPGADAVFVPDGHVLIDDDRVGDAVALDGGADIGGVGFVVIFVGMDAEDHDRLIRVFFFEDIRDRAGRACS